MVPFPELLASLRRLLPHQARKDRRSSANEKLSFRLLPARCDWLRHVRKFRHGSDWLQQALSRNSVKTMHSLVSLLCPVFPRSCALVGHDEREVCEVKILRLNIFQKIKYFVSLTASSTRCRSPQTNWRLSTRRTDLHRTPLCLWSAVLKRL